MCSPVEELISNPHVVNHLSKQEEYRKMSKEDTMKLCVYP